MAANQAYQLLDKVYQLVVGKSKREGIDVLVGGVNSQPSRWQHFKNHVRANKGRYFVALLLTMAWAAGAATFVVFAPLAILAQVTIGVFLAVIGFALAVSILLFKPNIMGKTAEYGLINEQDGLITGSGLGNDSSYSSMHEQGLTPSEEDDNPAEESSFQCRDASLFQPAGKYSTEPASTVTGSNVLSCGGARMIFEK